MSKIMNFLFLMVPLIALDHRVNSEFTDLDVKVIEHLGKYFNSQCFVFVENNEDVSLVKRIKGFGSNTYHTVVNSSHLERILENKISQLNFLQRRAVIVTKEDLNLTLLLSTVFFPHFLIWILFKDHTLLQRLYIPFSSKVFFVHSTPKTVSIKEVYHLKFGLHETVKTLDWQGRTPDPRKINLQGLGMDMLVLTPPEFCLNIHKKLLLRKLECVHQDFIQLLAEKLNFSINVVECLEKEFPFIFPNGSDSELFQRIKNHEVNISAINNVVFTREKRAYLDFVWPTFVLKSRMYLKQGRFEGRWSSYLKPLEASVWWGILLWISIAGMLLQVFEKLLLSSMKFNSAFVLDLIMSYLRTLQVFCNQAIPEVSDFYSIRILNILELFVVLIFFQAYCGYLVSSLTIVSVRFPFTDLKGFFANQEYHMMTLNKGFHQFFFRKVIGEEQGEDFLLPAHELPGTVQEAVNKLCESDRLAFTEFREDLLNFDTLKCRISELPSPMLQLHVGIAMPTDAPAKEFLKRELLYLKSIGIAKRLGSRLSSQQDFRDEKSGNEFSAVSISQIFSIFILLGMGIILSMIIFVLELVVENVKKRSFAFLQDH